MRIIVTIVHYWNPKGSGRHASLRPNLQNRLFALQDQLLSLKRLSTAQGVLNISSMSVDNANQSLRHSLTIKVVTDGQNHVLDHMDSPYKKFFEEIVVHPAEPKQLGFEAHKILADNLENHYDLYVYLEDDLLILDPLFFHKIFWFQLNVGQHAVLMPHRFELSWRPSEQVDRFYIDGPMIEDELRHLIPSPPDSLSTPLPGGNILFESPKNPHSGCFVLSHSQMLYWSNQVHFKDRDSSLISPLESAATLGLLKTFTLYKPHIAYASFLEMQHWGTSFRELIGSQIKFSTE